MAFKSKRGPKAFWKSSFGHPASKPRKSTDIVETDDERSPLVQLAELVNPGVDFFEQFILGDTIAYGAFGVIYEASSKQALNQVFAVKVIKFQLLEERKINLLIKELRVLRNIHHPCLVRHIDSFIRREDLYIVLEYCETGSLSDIYEDLQSPFTEKQTIFIAHEVLQGLHYLHMLGIIHRDIKAGNILLTRNGDIKVADFGTCGSVTENKRSEGFVGTPCWMAPEVIQCQENDGPYDATVDIWSLGITCIELLECGPPHSLEDPIQVFWAITNGPPPELKNPDSYSLDFLQFHADCLTKDPKSRPQAIVLLKYPLFNHIDKTVLRELGAMAGDWLGWSWAESESAESSSREGSTAGVQPPTKQRSTRNPEKTLRDSSSPRHPKRSPAKPQLPPASISDSKERTPRPNTSLSPRDKSDKPGPPSPRSEAQESPRFGKLINSANIHIPRFHTPKSPRDKSPPPASNKMEKEPPKEPGSPPTSPRKGVTLQPPSEGGDGSPKNRNSKRRSAPRRKRSASPETAAMVGYSKSSDSLLKMSIFPKSKEPSPPRVQHPLNPSDGSEDSPTQTPLSLSSSGITVIERSPSPPRPESPTGGLSPKARKAGGLVPPLRFDNMNRVRPNPPTSGTRGRFLGLASHGLLSFCFSQSLIA